MLIPAKPALQFDPWDAVVTSPPAIATFLSLSSISGNPQDDYNEHVESRPRQLACLLNLITAMSKFFLPTARRSNISVGLNGIRWQRIVSSGTRFPLSSQKSKMPLRRSFSLRSSTRLSSMAMRLPASKKFASEKPMCSSRSTRKRRRE